MFQLTTSQGLADPGLQCMGLRAAFDGSLPTSRWAAAATTQVLVGLISLEDWQPWLPEARGLIDAAERGRVERRRFPANRDELTLCYALHRLLLGNALGCDPTDVPLTRDTRGCPRLADGSLCTSLSHANGCIALTITATGPVGIDIERAARAAEMPEIAERVCHPVDAAVLAGLVQPAWGVALLALWVRKEALLKAAGVGLERAMNDFEASRDGLLSLSPPAGEKTQLRMLDAGPHWVAAVAAPPGVPIQSAWLRPIGSRTVER